MIAEEARKYIGYLEHYIPELLGIPTANVGLGGYTIFAKQIRDATGYDFSVAPWCVVFVYAMFLNVLGKKRTRKLLGKPTASVKLLRKHLKRQLRGADYVPKKDDLIFMREGGRISHVGIVAEVKDGKVLSIDGNTVDPIGVFKPPEGGAVAYRVRDLGDESIAGYAEIQL